MEDEQMAANVEETTEVVEQPTSPVEPVDQTKAFATRLKEEKAKAKLEAREEIAQSFGYDSWEAYCDAQTNKKLEDNGLDAETVRPVLKDLIKSDPDYVRAIKKAQEYEELEKEMFASDSIKKLNSTYGTNYQSINDLDPETIKMWNEGTPLEKAFAANNYKTIVDIAVKNATSRKKQDAGKSHLNNVSGNNTTSATREVSKAEVELAKRWGFTEEEIKKRFANSTK